MRRSRDEQARRLQMMREKQRNREDLTTWSAEKILQTFGEIEGNSTSRIVGIYQETGVDLTSILPVNIGVEGMIFVGVDRVTGRKVVAHYYGLTGGVGVDFLIFGNVGMGAFSFNGSPEDMAGASVGVQGSAGHSVSASYSVGGETEDGKAPVMVMYGGNTALGANLAAGWTWLAESENDEGYLIIAGQDALKNGRLVGPAQKAALSQIVNSKTGTVHVELKLPKGRTLKRTYTRAERDDGTLKVTFSDRVYKANGEELGRFDTFPEGASEMPHSFTIDKRLRRAFEPEAQAQRRHRERQGIDRVQPGDAPLPLDPVETDHTPASAPSPLLEQNRNNEAGPAHRQSPPAPPQAVLSQPALSQPAPSQPAGPGRQGQDSPGQNGQGRDSQDQNSPADDAAPDHPYSPRPRRPKPLL